MLAHLALSKVREGEGGQKREGGRGEKGERIDEEERGRDVTCLFQQMCCDRFVENFLAKTTHWKIFCDATSLQDIYFIN